MDPRAAALQVLQNAEALRSAAPKAEAAAAAPAGDTAGKAADGATAQAAPSPADDAPTPEALRQRGEDLRRGFGKLATEKAALLKSQQENKAAVEAAKRWNEIQAQIKADPAAVLEAHGLTLEQVAEAYLIRTAGKPQPTVEDLQRRLDERDAAERAAADKRQADEAAATAQSKYDGALSIVRSRLEAAADKYPATIARGEFAEVHRALSAYVHRHQIPIEQVTLDTLDVVAAAYEEARQEQLAEEVSGLVSKVPKIAARVAPPRTEMAPSGTNGSGAKGTSSATLAASAISEAPPPAPKKSYTKEELQRAALAVLRGEQPSFA